VFFVAALMQRVRDVGVKQVVGAGREWAARAE
jgi:hypothetical protein